MMLFAMLSHVFRAFGFVFAFLFEAVELLDEEAEEVAVFLRYLSMFQLENTTLRSGTFLVVKITPIIFNIKCMTIFRETP